MMFVTYVFYTPANFLQQKVITLHKVNFVFYVSMKICEFLYSAFVPKENQRDGVSMDNARLKAKSFHNNTLCNQHKVKKDK